MENAANTVNIANPDPEQWLGNFGLTEFRHGQRLVIDAIMSDRDTLCIMPTGGGKSLCFQLPSIARDGVTLVISPLIALMKDQVDSLIAIGIPATFINSSLPAAQQQARIQGMIHGEYKLVYIAPERLRSNAFMRAVSKTHIQLLAVDEAHCISQWGHDFRPDYARLGRFRKRIGNPQTIALTATATRLVQDDIANILELDNPATFVTGFARSNLHLAVEAPNGNLEKDEKLVEFLNTREGCGIIYASTRKNCEHLVELLSERTNRNLAFYHGGMESQARRTVQESFMTGETQVIVATNAFGMGIDKSDLRFVIHYNLPGSVEAYYQEAGRAGRDGNPSQCLMLYSFQDKFIQEFFIENSYPSRETIKQVYDYLRNIQANPIEMTLQELKDDLSLSLGTTGIANCENLLEKARGIERLDSTHNSAAIRIDSDLPTLVDFLPREARTQRHVLRGLERITESFRGERVMFQPQKFATSLEMKWEAVNRAIRQLIKLPMIDYIPPFRGRAVYVVDRNRKFEDLNIDFDELQRRKDSEYEKLQRVIKFATTRRCRQLEILEYFGDPDRQLCGNCDNCGKRPKLETGTAKFSDGDACLYAAQVALSGTARTHGRIGKTLIAQMLTGSTSKKVSQLGLNRISTFGLLKELRQSDVVLLMEFLIQQALIKQMETTKFRPVVQISDQGRALMSGSVETDIVPQMPSKLVTEISRKLKGKKPRLRRKVNANVADLPEAATETESDQSDGIQSQTVNDHDSQSANEPDSIREANAAPSDGSPLGLGSPPPVAHVSVSDSSAAVAHEQPPESSETPTPIEHSKQTVSSTDEVGGLQKSITRVDLPAAGSMKPSYFWTWRLLADGYQIGHLQQVRQLDHATIFDHATRAIENGLPARAEWLLSASQLQVLRAYVAANSAAGTSELLGGVPEGISPCELLYFLKSEPSNGLVK